MTTDEIIAARVTKYTMDLLRHRAPSQPDGVCRCDECIQGRHMLSELGYIQMAIRNLDRTVLPAHARAAGEYDASMGPVLWWKFPISEPPYVGAPDDCGMTVEVDIRHYVGGAGEVKTTSARTDVGGWPGYHTHFTPIALPTPPSIEKSGGEK